MNKINQNTTKTYFYVFVQIETSEHVQKEKLGNASNKISKPAKKGEIEKEISPDTELLDDRVTQAFKRFQKAFANEAHVIINPENFHDYRTMFDIKKLPAFGIYKKDLSEKVGQPKPERLPSPLEFWKRKDRVRLIAAKDLYPMVEKGTLEYFKDVDGIFNFIRDLHIANIDSGLEGTVKIIDSRNTQIAGRKAGEMFKMGKDFIKFW